MSSSDESSTAAASTSGGVGRGTASGKMLLHREIDLHPAYKQSRENGTLQVTFTKVRIQGFKDNKQRWKSECTITSPGIETVTIAGNVFRRKKDAQHSAADEMRGYLLAKRHSEGTMIYLS
jgi:hypothetical protein